MSTFLNPYHITVLTNVGITLIAALGLNIISGIIGQTSLGHAAFFGIGAYCSAMLTTQLSLTFWQALPISIVVTWVFGLMLSFTVLRFKDDFLAIVTMGVGMIFQSLAENWDWIGGVLGIGDIPRPFLGSTEMDNPQFLVLVLLMIALGTFIQVRLVRSRVGRAFVALREDDLAAKAIGINTVRYKVLAFALGAAYAGVAGALYGAFTGFISPGNFGFDVSITLVAMIVLGGLGSIRGVFAGVLILGILPEVSRSLADYRMLAYGLLLVLLMRYRPQGILGGGKPLKWFPFGKFLKKSGAEASGTVQQ